MFETVLAELAALPAGKAASAANRLDRIAVLERLTQLAQAEQTRELADFEAARRAADTADGVDGRLRGADVPFDVAGALTVATLTATRRLTEARLAADDLPELLRLVGTGPGAGRLSMAGLRKVVDTVLVLDSEHRRIVDSNLAGEVRAAPMTPGRLAMAAERRALEIDPQAATKRARQARAARRGVRLGDPVDGVAGVFALLKAEEALAVFGRLDRTARGMRHDGDLRSLNCLMADLFVEGLAGRPAGPADASEDSRVPERPPQESPVWRSDAHGWEPWLWSEAPEWWTAYTADPHPSDPVWDRLPDTILDGPMIRDMSPHGDPPDGAPTGPPGDRASAGPHTVELQVVLTAAMLLGLDDGPALLRGYGALPMDIVRDLAADTQAAGGRTVLRALFCDPVDGRLLAMDKHTRRFTGLLGDFSDWREQHCRLSGGTIRHRDHIHEHSRGGPTAAGNAQGLAVRAHTLRDHPRVDVTAIALAPRRDGLDSYRANSPDVRWTLPTGHTYDRSPPPALGPGSTAVSPDDHTAGDTTGWTSDAELHQMMAAFLAGG